MKRILFDLETNGFLEVCTKIHCIAACDVDTGEKYVWGPDEVAPALKVLAEADVLIGHNAQRFDLPVLTKLYGFKLNENQRLLDTLIIARLIHSDIKETDADRVRRKQMPSELMGKHTLKSWGYRLGEHKAEFEGPWEEWSQEMQDYCEQDVATNVRLWKFLKVENYSSKAIELEHRIARVCDEMEKAGCPFDTETAQKLHGEWKEKQAELEQTLVDQFGFWFAPISPTKARYEFTPNRDDKKNGYVKGSTCCKIKKVIFNPGSRDHIAKVLMDRGWKPQEKTDGGKPKIDEKIVNALVQRYPEVSGLADYLTITKRLSQLVEGEQAWLGAVKEDGLIHGVINPMGTQTSRASHFSPNLAQVPKVASPYGKECRALFGKRKGFKLIGADMSGLELRGLAHYLYPHDKGLYVEVVTKGDPHWYHAQAMGLVPEGTEYDEHNKLYLVIREDGSKRWIYAYIYGMGDKKSGIILLNCCDKARRQCGEAGEAFYVSKFGTGKNPEGLLSSVGGDARAGFASRIVGFADLKNKLTKQVKQFGFVPGLDGRRIPVRSDHSALNYLIQSCGAILCKQWVCDAFEHLEKKYKHGWDGDFVFVLWVHDEIQVAVREGLEEEIGNTLVEFARKAGEPFGFRVPLDSKYKIGANWSETH